MAEKLTAASMQTRFIPYCNAPSTTPCLLKIAHIAAFRERVFFPSFNRNWNLYGPRNVGATMGWVWIWRVDDGECSEI